MTWLLFAIFAGPVLFIGADRLAERLTGGYDRRQDDHVKAHVAAELRRAEFRR